MNGETILLVDDDSELLQAVAQRCEALGLRVVKAHNLLTAATLIERCVPDIICVDVNLPTGNGLRFCEMVAADPTTAGVPIVVLSGQKASEIVDTCRRSGYHYVAKGPEMWTSLDPLLQMLTQNRSAAVPTLAGLGPRRLPNESSSQQHFEDESAARDRACHATRRVVVADDDEDLVVFLSQRLSSLGCSVLAAGSAIEAINVIYRVTPNLVILDVNMPGGNGLSVCEMMNGDERLRATPAIVLTGRSDEQTIRRCHDMLVFYVQKGATIWSRIEPLVCELLHLPTPELPWMDPATSAETTAIESRG